MKPSIIEHLIIERLTIEGLKHILREVVEQSLQQRQSEESFLTITEASLYLKIPITTLYEYTSHKKIPFYKKGKTLHFSSHELKAWMKSKDGKEVSHERLI